tara:strand:- start:3061 stop:3402 length:342 start_codon:yes stop_codon:yes gene_type:complete
MAAYISNIVIDAGADFNQTFNLEGSNNSALNLTGYYATAKMKKHPASLNDTATFAVSFPNRPQGQLKISLTSNVTASLKAGRYSYDVLLESDAGLKTRVIGGSAIVTAGVTLS